MSTRTAYYLVQNQTYAPINIVPSNLIKCTHCNHYVEHSEIKYHMQMHILPQHSLALSEAHNNHRVSCSKLKIQDIIAEDVFAKQHEDISVKSFLPEEMPTADNFRKQAMKAPTPIHLKCKSNENSSKQKSTFSEISGFCTQSNSQNPDELDVNSRFTQQQIQLQFHQNITFKKQIQYLTNTTGINHKKINQFENRNTQKGIHIDHVKVLSKKQNEQVMNMLESQKQNKSEAYIIAPYKQNYNTKAPVKVQIKSNNRSPLVKQKISTVSTSGTGFFKGPKLSNFFGNQSQSSQQTRNNANQAPVPHIHLQKNLQCSSCKGFYCKQCGSDIPPIYRPVPTNLDIYNHPNEETKSFYASHVYSHKNGKTSRVTHCASCE